MAYTNFQHCTEEEYTNIIYSQDAKNKIKILFNNVELANADRYCEKLTRKERILPDDSSKRFSLDNFISQELELILHDVDSSVIKDQVSISIGTLVDENNDVYEYVPLGIFNIQDTPTTDKNKITVKLRDNRVKFDFNYNGKELIDAHDGSATKLQILQDICSKAGVQTTITSFAGDSDLIGIYDNTITATTYISYLAEQAGAIAKIDREGKLIFTYLTDSKNTTIAGSGTIDDSFNGGLIDFQIEGKAEQHSYSGKNLFDINGNVNVKGNNGSAVSENTVSNNILTSNLDLDHTHGTGQKFTNLNGKTITFSADVISVGTGTQCWLLVYDGGGTYKSTAKTSTINTRISITYTCTTNNVVCAFGTKGGTGGQYKNIQVEISNSETSYEPFTNNLPTPNPYYPEEIKTVSGIENILPNNATTTTKNGVTLTVNDDKSITLNGTTTANVYVSLGTINVLNGEILTISGVTGYTSSTLQLFTGSVSAFPAGNRLSCSNGSKTVTAMADENNLDVGVYVYSGNTFNNVTIYPMIEKGSVAHQYVPYGHWLPVKVSNKNIFDGIIELGTISSTGVPTASDSVIRSKNFTKVEEGNIVISYENGPTSVVVYGYDKNYNFIMSFPLHTTSTTGLDKAYRIDILESIKYIKFRFNTGFTTTSIKVQIEQNSTATDYIEHQEQTTLIDLNKYDENNNIVGNYEICSIGNIKDLLTIKNGRAKITKNINSTLFNGTYIVSVGNYKGIYGSNMPPNKIAQANVGLVYERAKFITSGRVENTIYENTGNVVVVGAENDTLATLQEKFNGGLLYYVLATPETITLKGTYDINLYEGVNHISIEDELEPTMNITYSIEKTPKRIPLSIVEKYELGTPFKIERIVYEDALRKYQTSDDSEKQTLYINSANPYISNQLQIDNISARTKNFIIDSVNTGKILGNPALDSYDLIEVYDDYSQETTKPIIFRTLANNDLTYNGVLISEYDTQIGLEERTENVTINGEATFKKWAKTEIDNVNGTIETTVGNVALIQQSSSSNSDNINTLTSLVDSQGEDIERLETRITQNVDSINASVTAIQGEIEQGVGLVKTTSVTIDDNGLSVSTDTSKIQTTMTNDTFKITDKGGTELAKFGYDENEGISTAEMDNLTVKNYFIAGVHRVETIEIDGEERTGWFYMGG